MSVVSLALTDLLLDDLIAFIKENKVDEKILTDVQQSLRASRWNKPAPVRDRPVRSFICEMSFAFAKGGDV